MINRIALSMVLALLLSVSSWGATVLLPQTGQTSCYDSSGNLLSSCQGTGQDGELRAGLAWPAPRFIDNGNGTMGDQLTNLVWTKDADAPNYTTCGSSAPAMDWQSALDYIDCLNTSNYLGANDWALPNVNQLASMINYQTDQNAQWLMTTGFQNVQSDHYWTNDTYSADSTKAWTISAEDGQNFQESKLGTEKHVWPVRIAPDLVVSYISAPATATTGSQIIIPITWSNIGSGVSPVNVQVKLYLSTDAEITSDDILLNGLNFSPLGVGQSQSFNWPITVPPVDSGNYYIGAIVDSSETIAESNETNNSSASLSVTAISIGADLVVTSVSAPATAATGEQITVPVTWSNIGSGTTFSNIQVKIYLSQDENISESDIYLSGLNFSPLGAGQSKTFNWPVTMPLVNSGNYYIGAIVDSSGANPESNETNNSGASLSATAISIGADLVVTSVSTPATATTGEQITVPVTWSNMGSGMTFSNIQVKLYLSQDENISESDTYLSGLNFSLLGAGQSKTFNWPITMPQTPGSYYIGAIVDASGANPESNETNNSGASAVVTVSSP